MSKAESQFSEEVTKFLDAHDIRYIPKTKFAGKSGLDHMLDFVIPKSRHAPERVVQVLDSPSADRVRNILFTISDTRAIRGKETDYYALLNDQKRAVSTEMTLAFIEYQTKAHLWSNATNLSVLPGQKLCGAASERPAVTTCPSTVDGTAGSRPKPAGGAGGALGSARLVGWRQTAPELRKCSLS